MASGDNVHEATGKVRELEAGNRNLCHKLVAIF